MLMMVLETEARLLLSHGQFPSSPCRNLPALVCLLHLPALAYLLLLPASAYLYLSILACHNYGDWLATHCWRSHQHLLKPTKEVVMSPALVQHNTDGSLRHQPVQQDIDIDDDLKIYAVTKGELDD